MKFLLGEASAGEEQAVKVWIEENQANRDYFNQFKLIWDTSKQLAAVSTVDENAAWQRFQNRVKEGAKETVLVKKMNFSWMRIAAAFILIIGAGVLGYIFFSNGGTPKQLLAQTQENILKDTLPDGSTITLNKKSSLSYPEKFKGDNRKVTLKGEAFFNVAPDKKKPFIISVNDVQVTVVGTSFNVKSENGNTEVIVETGIVKVTKAGKTVDLRPGEKTMIRAADYIPVMEKVTDKLYNYYRSREFVCDSTPLWKLAEVLSEAYNVHIVIARPELRNQPISTTYNNEPLDHILELIGQTFFIKITRNGDEIVFQ